MSVEEWRPVPGFAGYRVSDRGRVVSARRGTDRVLAATPDRHGYPRVSLSRGTHNDKADRYVHSLVMLAFVGPRPEGMEVCHLDGDETNNALANLRYGTSSENELDKVRHGTHHNARKTHCKRGHEYTPENTHTSRSGARVCKTCLAASSRAVRARRKAAA